MTSQTREPQKDALHVLNELAAKDPEYAGASAAYHLVQGVAEELRSMRRRAGLRQRELGKLLGLSQGRISQLESGLVDYAPSLELVAKVAAACGERAAIHFSGQDVFKSDLGMEAAGDLRVAQEVPANTQERGRYRAAE